VELVDPPVEGIDQRQRSPPTLLSTRHCIERALLAVLFDRVQVGEDLERDRGPPIFRQVLCSGPSTMRPNWFFAFPLDGRFVLELPELPPSFRRYHPDDMHLTLSFLGGCGEEAARRALAALDRALAESPLHGWSIALGEVVPMGPRARYSALSALLSQGREETESCIGRLRDVVSEAALGKRERRPPKPHVTLARPGRQATEARRAEGLAWARSQNLSAVTARLTSIALYTWHEERRKTERLFHIVAQRALC
jgi:2'-5' RNA ligase